MEILWRVMSCVWPVRYSNRDPSVKVRVPPCESRDDAVGQ